MIYNCLNIGVRVTGEPGGRHLDYVWFLNELECSRIWNLSGNFIKKCRDFLGRDILGTTFFRAESSLIQSICRSFIRVIVPNEISKVNFRVETNNLDTFWWTGWAWNCQIIFRCASIHGRAGFILCELNEDLLNIKRNCDPEVSYPLSYSSYRSLRNLKS
jgi:hypothetical protein